MKRDADYQVAKDRVKVSHFTEQGYDLKGIIHVGTNDGYEMHWYRMMGVENLLGFECLPSAIALFRERYPDIPLIEYALSDRDDTALLYITLGDGQGSSLHWPTKADYELAGQVNVQLRQFTTVLRHTPWLDLRRYDTLVLDVQGHELQALHGFGATLRLFDFLNIECSRVPIYKGEAPASEVVAYLVGMGFRQDSPVEEHNDIFFIREGR